jgi:uncharacterized LabA/DUF88 family protein
LPDVALFIDWENVYYTYKQHREGRIPSSLVVLQAILKKAAEYGTVRVRQAIFGQEVAAQDETLLMALEFTGIEPIAVAQRMSGRLLKGRADAVLIVRALRMLYKERPDIESWFIVSGDRDLNALCKALKDEDKHVYLIAGDTALANELRESPYLRDEVFLLEDLVPESRFAPVAAPARTTEEPGRPPVGRRAPARQAPPRQMPPATIVPTGPPAGEREQRRLAVLLLDHLVATDSPDMPRGEFVESVIPRSDLEGGRALDSLIDAGIAQQHLMARAGGRSRAKASQRLALNYASPLVAETAFQLVRLLRRIDTVTAKDNRRIPVVEAVLDPLSRADQPGASVQGRSQRRALLETLFSICEERGAVASELIGRGAQQVAVCWIEGAHPLVGYARRRGASVILLLNFATVVAERAEEREWTNASLIPELLARAEGDELDAIVRDLIEAGAVRAEERGPRRRLGYVLVREHPLVESVLGAAVALAQPAETAPARKRPTRRGTRGGRRRRRPLGATITEIAEARAESESA